MVGHQWVFVRHFRRVANACLNNVAAEVLNRNTTFDSVKGSDYLGDKDAIEFFCSRCPEGVLEVDHMGAPFSHTEAK